MKKISALLLVFAIFLSLGGCKNDVSIDKIYFNSMNYNNEYLTCNLWINNDVYFYNYDGFYNMRTFVYKNGHRIKLFESNDFVFDSNETYHGEFFPINDFAYFATYSEDGSKNLYKYSFADQSYKKLFTAKGYYEWMGTVDYIAFTKYHDEEYTLDDLFVYNIKKDTTTSIYNGILSFGIVNNKIRYLTSVNTDTLAFFEYDHTNNESKKIGEISAEIKDEYPIYNFTNNYIIIAQYDSDDYRKFTVYSSDGSTCEYTLPKPIQQFVAGDHYAYAVCYETEEYSSSAVEHKDNGIYKINLAAGSYEVVETLANDDTEIHVISDDEIYITQYELNVIGQYKGHVYKMIVRDRIKTKIFVI